MLSMILLCALIIMLASLIGVIFVWKGFGKFLEKRAQYLTTFSGGVFLVLIYAMVTETFHLATSPWIAIGSIAFGVLIIEAITRLIPAGHHHHTLPPSCNKKHSHIDARRMLWSDSFHNLGDGILLAGAFMIDVHIGIAATIGIFLHEIVQEISEFFVLREAGYSTKRALAYNFLTSSTILIGVLLGVTFASIESFIALLIGFAAGGFIYVLFRDLVPHAIHSSRETHTEWTHIFVFIIGISTMILANSLVPHSHEHDHMTAEEDHDEENHNTNEIHTTEQLMNDTSTNQDNSSNP